MDDLPMFMLPPTSTTSEDSMPGDSESMPALPSFPSNPALLQPLDEAGRSAVQAVREALELHRDDLRRQVIACLQEAIQAVTPDGLPATLGLLQGWMQRAIPLVAYADASVPSRRMSGMPGSDREGGAVKMVRELVAAQKQKPPHEVLSGLLESRRRLVEAGLQAEADSLMPSIRTLVAGMARDQGKRPGVGEANAAAHLTAAVLDAYENHDMSADGG